MKDVIIHVEYGKITADFNTTVWQVVYALKLRFPYNQSVLTGTRMQCHAYATQI